MSDSIPPSSSSASSPPPSQSIYPDDLPSGLSSLLRQVSVEYAAASAAGAGTSSDVTSGGVVSDGWIDSAEEKLKLQEKIRQHAIKRQEAAAASASDTTTSVAPPIQVQYLSPFASSSSSSSALPATALSSGSGSIPYHPDLLPSTGPTLLNELSAAAAAGIISHEFKTHLKHLLLTSRINAMSTKRLVRSVSVETGEVTISKESMDLSHINEDACAEMQQEERDAIEAIYEELVTFEVTNEKIEEEGEEDDEDEEEEEEVKEKEEMSPTGGTPNTNTGSPEVKENDGDGGVAAGVDSQQCITVTVRVKPYPASGPERNPVSALVKFTLPPLYPYVRPAVELVSVVGMTDSDGMMCNTAMNACLNSLYSIEPMSELDVRVVLFDIITAGQNFLIEYVEYLEDQEYHQQLALKKVAEKRRAEEDAERQERVRKIKEEEIRHAQAVLEYLAKEAKLDGSLNLYDYNIQAKELEIASKKSFQEQLDAENAAREAREAAVGSKSIDPNVYTGATIDGSLIPSADAMISRLERDRSFYELFKRCSPYEDMMLEDITSPFLVYRFTKQRERMSSKGLGDISIGYHGTAPTNVESITTNGLIVPGQVIESAKYTYGEGPRLGHRTDGGYYGKVLPGGTKTVNAQYDEDA